MTIFFIKKYGDNFIFLKIANFQKSVSEKFYFSVFACLLSQKLSCVDAWGRSGVIEVLALLCYLPAQAGILWEHCSGGLFHF